MGFGLNFGTKLYTMRKGTLVGTDEYGNKYYKSTLKEGENVGRHNTERRWVDYNGLPEPSKVPPYWHGWLHHMSDDEPTEEDKKPKYKWQKPHIPNLTGTKHAYNPADSFKDDEREKAIGDYEAWDPKS